jgi:hypothetical protein
MGEKKMTRAEFEATQRKMSTEGYVPDTFGTVRENTAEIRRRAREINENGHHPYHELGLIALADKINELLGV